MASVESREGEVVPEIKAELKRALEWAGDARTRKWLEKRSEDKIKRQQRRLRTQGPPDTHQGVRRLVPGSGPGVGGCGRRGAQSGPARASCAPVARPGALAAYTQAVGAVQRAEERLRYNVDARCAIGDMFRINQGGPRVVADVVGVSLPQWNQDVLLRSRRSRAVERRPGGRADRQRP